MLIKKLFHCHICKNIIDSKHTFGVLVVRVWPWVRRRRTTFCIANHWTSNFRSEKFHKIMVVFLIPVWEKMHRSWFKIFISVMSRALSRYRETKASAMRVNVFLLTHGQVKQWNDSLISCSGSSHDIHEVPSISKTFAC